MNPEILTMKHLARTAGDSSLRRPLAARLDRALERAGISSANSAKSPGVAENEVHFWRHGITVPELQYFSRLANILQLDVHWLCTGQTQTV
ncbi:XRE family transcriptional regulator [Paraburkholderia aromaticivorans]|uniref:XRE family transcriptional regulator n=1 Tax=Paraburkholderia aromaticivorans TaxID=2026199 RepID=UPI001F0EA3EC|nr:XRE family transcriptional regulator [Paraburkholderia aromaticivorans]